MRLERLVSVAAFALVASACTKVNPNYCADAGADLRYSCAAAKDARARDAVTEASEVADASDAEDTGDGNADMAEAMPEAMPVCSMDMDCASKDAGVPACDMSDGGAKCVECTSNTHCKADKPVCDKAAEKCVECIGTGTECTGTPGKSVCNATTQSCVECLDNSKCMGVKPICDATTKACRPCTADSECKDIGPGICVDWDGHCAAATEVVTLQNAFQCVPDAPSRRFCLSTEATSMLSTVNPILLVKGPAAVGALNIQPNTPQVLVVGQGGAFVGAGLGDAAGVHVAGGATKFWVRDLKISGGTVGVLADTGADLHLTRATIVGNGAGGILTRNATFDITSSIIAMNNAGDSSGGVVWAGARLGDVPSGGSAHFENNTVVGNLATGVSCSTTYAIVGSIVRGNMAAQIAGCLASTPCCGATDPDPMLDATYRLMSTSPCIDKLTATAMTPATDIDGQPRPTAAGKLDCGADEFQ
jgi:hypothetical protein